ncbi:MAG: hypothetical protein H7832_11885 [Magnetococcus sp. DMHC-6]
MAVAGTVMGVLDLTQGYLEASWWQHFFSTGQTGDKNRDVDPERLEYNAVFRSLVEEFMVLLLADSRERLRKGRVPMESQEQLWHLLFRGRLRSWLAVRMQDPRQVATGLQLAKALKLFCIRQESLKQRTDWFTDWSDLFLVPGGPLKTVRFNLGGRSLGIKSSWWQFRRHPVHGVEVVDWRFVFTDTKPKQEDFLGMAISAHLLELLRPGITFVGTLESYGTRLESVGISQKELGELFRERVRDRRRCRILRTSCPAGKRKIKIKHKTLGDESPKPPLFFKKIKKKGVWGIAPRVLIFVFSIL